MTIADGEFESAGAERARQKRIAQEVDRSLDQVSMLVMPNHSAETMLIFPAHAQREALRLQKMMLQKYGKLSETSWELTSVHGIWMLNCPRYGAGESKALLPEIQTLADKAVVGRLAFVTADPQSDAFAQALSVYLDQLDSRSHLGGGISLN